MKELKRVVLAGTAAFLFAACHGHDHNDHDGHDHDELAEFTVWTDDYEFFVEYAPLEVHVENRFVLHVTRLSDFSPVESGDVELLASADGRDMATASTGALRESGIFEVYLAFIDDGTYDLLLDYNFNGDAGQVSLDHVHVGVHGHSHSSEQDNDRGHTHGETSVRTPEGLRISVSKEYQWQAGIRVAEVRTGQVRHSAYASAEILPRADSRVEISAPVAGMIDHRAAGQFPVPGTWIGRGELLAVLAPPPVDGGGWMELQLRLDRARDEYERAQRLRETEAISEREFRQIETDFLVRQRAFEAFQDTTGGSSVSDADGRLHLTAPSSGIVSRVYVLPGETVRAGDRIMSVIDPSSVWIKLNVLPSAFEALPDISGAALRMSAGQGNMVELDHYDHRLISIGSELDTSTRTIPVIFEVSNAMGVFRVGDAMEARLYSSAEGEFVTVPETAIFDEDVARVVFVQTGGETFERRVVRTGPRDQGLVAIEDGLMPGERVVTVGVYHVNLASANIEVDHGHDH